MTSTPSDANNLPPMPELPVVRDTYCSQKTTDEAIGCIWRNRPDLVKEMLWFVHTHFDIEYRDAQWHAIAYLQKMAETDKIEIPETRIGILDLFYEFSRRLCRVRGIPEYEVKGRPLADSSNAPMPALPVLPVRLLKDGQFYPGVTQEVADRLIAEAYEKRPDLFWEFSEGLRRGFTIDSGQSLADLFQELSAPQDDPKPSSAMTLVGEVARRVRAYCNLPTYEHNLPPMPELPVYRETYLNQQRTDELCLHIREHRPDLLARLFDEEKLSYPHNRQGLFGRVIGDIVHFFRAEEREGRIEALSLTAMVDLTYEIDRRVRRALGLEDVKPTGDPIAPGPEGPFPPLEDFPSGWFSGEAKKIGELEPCPARTQAETFWGTLLRENPEAIFAAYEIERRELTEGEPRWIFFNLKRQLGLPTSPPRKSIKEDVPETSLRGEPSIKSRYSGLLRRLLASSQ